MQIRNRVFFQLNRYNLAVELNSWRRGWGPNLLFAGSATENRSSFGRRLFSVNCNKQSTQAIITHKQSNMLNKSPLFICAEVSKHRFKNFSVKIRDFENLCMGSSLHLAWGHRPSAKVASRTKIEVCPEIFTLIGQHLVTSYVYRQCDLTLLIGVDVGLIAVGQIEQVQELNGLSKRRG